MLLTIKWVGLETVLNENIGKSYSDRNRVFSCAEAVEKENMTLKGDTTGK